MTNTLLTLRIVHTTNGYVLEHNGLDVRDAHGNNCWSSLDEVTGVFSKLVLSDALIRIHVLDVPPQCITPYMNGDIEC